MARKRRLPYNEKARWLRKLEEVWLKIYCLQSHLEHQKSNPKLEAELKQLGDKYLNLWKQLKKSYHLTDEELAFAEAEMVVEQIISARDMVVHMKYSHLVRKYLPKAFTADLQKLGYQAIEINNKQFISI